MPDRTGPAVMQEGSSTMTTSTRTTRHAPPTASATAGEALTRHLRAIYGPSEPRLPLVDRRVSHGWTRMEAELFAVVSRYWDRQGQPPLFTERARVVTAMLNAFDDA